MVRSKFLHDLFITVTHNAESSIFTILSVGCSLHFFYVGFRYWTHFPQAVQIPGEYARWDDPVNYGGFRTLSKKYPMFGVPLELPPEY